MTREEQRAFRDALGRFATGVAIMTTRGEGGEPVGFTANSFASVSLDPPLVLFCLNRSARCLPAFEASPFFAVNILAETQQALSTRFATVEAERWHGVAWSEGAEGSPLLAGSIATFECAREAVHAGGDHLVFIGRVLRFSAGPGAPLCYFRGSYRELGSGLGVPPLEDELGLPVLAHGWD